jgi:hypothetical protein
MRTYPPLPGQQSDQPDEPRTIEEWADEIQAELPESEREAIRQDAENEDLVRWRAGDRSIAWVQAYKNTDVPRTAVRLALAREYKWAEETIRDYERVSRAVPPELRNDHPILTHRMWREVIPADDMMELVVQIEEYTEAHGHVPSLSQISAWRDDDDKPVRLLWHIRMESLESTLERLVNDPRADVHVRQYLREVLAKVQEYIDRNINTV